MANRTEFRDSIANAIKAHVPIVTVESFEWERVEGIISGVTRKLGTEYLKITAERGLRLYDQTKRRWVTDHPMIEDQQEWSVANVIQWVRDELEGEVLLHVEDFHHNFQGDDISVGDHNDAQPGTPAHTMSWSYVALFTNRASAPVPLSPLSCWIGLPIEPNDICPIWIPLAPLPQSVSTLFIIH
mgnify:CR=1 FL=1